jgi:hypothetical protein
MPWFPDFASAVELARRQTRAAGRADPVGQYFAALNNGDPRALETVWPGEVTVHDPRAGRVHGHRQLREFVRRNQAWLAERNSRIETVAVTRVSGRAVVELLAHLDDGGRELAWPVAVVAESPDDRSVVFRTYCSQWPVDGRRHLRPPILRPGAVRPGGVVGRYHSALAAGDTEAIVSTFALDGYFRGPSGPHHAHRGPDELRSFFTRCFREGGGISLRCLKSEVDLAVGEQPGRQIRVQGPGRVSWAGNDQSVPSRRLPPRPGAGWLVRATPLPPTGTISRGRGCVRPHKERCVGLRLVQRVDDAVGSAPRRAWAMMQQFG